MPGVAVEVLWNDRVLLMAATNPEGHLALEAGSPGTYRIPVFPPAGYRPGHPTPGQIAFSVDPTGTLEYSLDWQSGSGGVAELRFVLARK